jgi:choline kinase
MLKVLVPMCGERLYSTTDDLAYPKLLTEVNNKTLLEYSLSSFNNAKEKLEMFFIAPEDKAKELEISSLLNIITSGNATLIKITGITKGALCTCLMAVDNLDDDDELIISSSEQYLAEDIDNVLEHFRSKNADAGVITFNSVHPKWSYVRKNENDEVVETSEKKVISRDAMIGFTYFKRAADFLESAMNVIRKGTSIGGDFYISSCLNELCLQGKSIVTKPICSKQYHNFYDYHSIKAFENDITSISSDLLSLSERYIYKFNNKDISVVDMFSDNAYLNDPSNSLNGKANILVFMDKLFNDSNQLDFKSSKVVADTNNSVIEFSLTIDGKVYKGVDILSWESGKIKSLDAYLY